MGITTPRKKPKHVLLSLIYRLQKLLPMSTKRKMKLFLDLEWIFDRLAMESSFKFYETKDHPFRRFAKEFLLHRIRAEHVVLDIGCHQGHITAMVATKAKTVVGVDHDSAAIEFAKRSYTGPNLTFLHMDAMTYLQGNSMKFDVLILSHILEHLDFPEQFLSDFKQYFDHIYIELPDFDKTYLNHYRQDLGMALIYTDDDHVSEFDRMELLTMLSKIGIKVEESEYRFGVQRLWCSVIR